MKEKNSGITLLALIITIIIMLILAGVTISIVGGSDGIINKAVKAVDETNKGAAKEQAGLLIAEIHTDYYDKRFVARDKDVSSKSLNKYTKEVIGNGKETATGDYFVTLADDGTIVVYEGKSAVAERKLAEGKLNDNDQLEWNEE